MEDQLHSFLRQGGRVLLVGGGIDKSLASPQILVWTGTTAEITRQLRAHNFELPSNCHALILSRFLKHKIIEPLMISARKRQITIFNDKTNSEITDLVRRMTNQSLPQVTPPVSPSPEPPPSPSKRARGDVAKFVEIHQKIENRVTEEAKRLLSIAEKEGVQTTLSSLKNAIYRVRLKCGVTFPKAEPKAKIQTDSTGDLLEILEQASTSIALVIGELKTGVLVPREQFEAYSKFVNAVLQARK